MRKILKLFNFFLWNSKLKIARSMEYRFNFILGSLIALIFSSMGPIMQYLIFTQTKGFPGWNLDQIILFQGVLLFVIGIRNLLFGDLHNFFQDLILKGDFDRLLLKPFPTIGLVLASSFHTNSIGSIIAGIVIIIYSIIKMQLIIGFFQIILFSIFVIMGLILFMSFEVLYACLVILMTQIFRFNDIIDFFSRFGEYPIEIYSNTVRLIFITIVPFVVVVNVPTRILLGVYNMNMLYGLVFTIVFFIISLMIWKFSLRKYTSAGG